MKHWSGGVALVVVFAAGCGSDDRSAGKSETEAPAGPSKVAELRLDPVSGAVEGTVTVRVVETSDELVLAFDEGLVAEGATSAGVAVQFSQTVYSPFNLVTVPVAEPGAAFEVSVGIRGTLACDKIGSGDDYTQTARLCYREPGQMALFKEGALVPAVVRVGAETHHTFRYDVTLHTPSESSIVATGEPDPPKQDGNWTTTRWRLDEPVSTGYTIVSGKFETVEFAGLDARVSLAHSVGEEAWNDDLGKWLPEVVPFVEDYAGRLLPFESVALVKLSPMLGDAGYNAQNMILLSDMHAGWGKALFEESWAHEFAHLFWAETVAPVDAPRTAVLSEGMAVLVQHDYGYMKHHAGEDRDLVLARRNREAELLERYVVPAVPPLVTSSAAETMPQGDVAGFWLWAYQKTAATLDYLRVVIGEAAFSKGVRRYTERCQHQECSFSDFIEAFEETSGRQLDVFAQQFFYQVSTPYVSVGFNQTEVAPGKWAVTVNLAQPSALIVPIELWLEKAQGAPRRELIELEGLSGSWSFESDEPLRSVRPNPRQQAVLASYSAVIGDLNYDGVNDDADRAACEALLGKYVDAPFIALGEAVSGVDLDFDPHCDADGDATITAVDLYTLFP